MPGDEYFEAFGKRVPTAVRPPPLLNLGDAPGDFDEESEEVETARKDDQGKDRWDLMPFMPLLLITEVITYGAKKYGADNWQKLDNGTNRYFAALMRHLTAWRMGESHDEESGLHHLAHAGCCIVFLLWLEGEK